MSSKLGRLAVTDPAIAMRSLPFESSTPSRTITQLVSVVTVHIPLRYNSSRKGPRRPVEFFKVNRTLREAQDYFGGFSLSNIKGWCRDDAPAGTWDIHLRVEIDVRLTRACLKFLDQWRRRLKVRFRQESIYMRIISQAWWL